MYIVYEIKGETVMPSMKLQAKDERSTSHDQTGGIHQYNARDLSIILMVKMLLENSNKSFQISFERTGVFVYVDSTLLDQLMSNWNNIPN